MAEFEDLDKSWLAPFLKKSLIYFAPILNFMRVLDFAIEKGKPEACLFHLQRNLALRTTLLPYQ
ncbi:hypothetical protein DP175_03745 [Polynucleobacter paneuropaeus]|nr:hypothetical protein DP175_03745 [Polynucleobacter paneuropaeus]